MTAVGVPPPQLLPFCFFHLNMAQIACALQSIVVMDGETWHGNDETDLSSFCRPALAQGLEARSSKF